MGIPGGNFIQEFQLTPQVNPLSFSLAHETPVTSLTGLGFPKRHRGCSGYSLKNSEYVKEHVHPWGRRNGVIPLDIYDPRGMDVLCKHCRESGLVSQGQGDRYERDIKPKLEKAEREAAEQEKKRLMEMKARTRPDRERLRRELGISAKRDSDMRLKGEGGLLAE